MSAPFDGVAQGYDAEFTHTMTGKLQRNQVWQYLEKQLSSSKPISILELNCGTGEDAKFLADLGHRVTATDLSGEMIKTAKLKSNKVEFIQLDMNNLRTLEPNNYDLIFSNFGGINCLSPEQLSSFLSSIKKLLSPEGRFIAVIMPKFCFTESLYFLLKLQPKKAFRRFRNNSLSVQLIDVSLPIWYYNPSTFQNRKQDETILLRKFGIGLFVPPSYLDRLYSKSPRLLSFLHRIDNVLQQFSWTSYISDHYLIDLKSRT